MKQTKTELLGGFDQPREWSVDDCDQPREGCLEGYYGCFCPFSLHDQYQKERLMDEKEEGRWAMKGQLTGLDRGTKQRR